MIEYFLREGETPEEFEDRVCLDKLKGKIRTWDDVADIINSALNQNKGESSYRKAFKKRQGEYDSYVDAFSFPNTSANSSTIEELEEDKIYKKTVELRDWATHKRRLLRDEARIEGLKEALKEPINSLPPLIINKNYVSGENEAILSISDWHYGDIVDNFYNKFNRKVFYARLQSLLDKTIEYIHKNSVRKLHVLNLGDLFAGNIHVSIRVQAETDVITQIKQVSEDLANFLNALGNEIEEVIYHSVVDNHSRTNKNYNEHIEKENLGKLIDWWLEERLKESNVKLITEELDDNIGYLKLENGKNVFFTHGHLDKKISNMVQNYTLSTGKIAHYVFAGHWHNKDEKEYQGSKVFINGSLKGVDEYALSNRLFSKPSQTLVVFNDSDEIDISINLG